jgi:putative ABC transport system permease protein
MSFLSLIFKNPFRSKVRASLSIVGIGIGIATIVLLGAITAGLTENVDGVLRGGGADFSVSGKSSENGGMFGTEDINETWLNNIKNINGVSEAVGTYEGDIFLIQEVGAPVIGINPTDVKFADVVITGGKLYNGSKNEIILGKLGAEYLNKSVNDSITLKGTDYKIVGIFESGNSFMDWSGLIGLKNAQTLDDSSENSNISMIYAKLDSDANVDEVKKEIEDKYGDNVTVISSLTDIESMASTMDMINAASLGISILAIIIGAIGIVNTMVTSVYERTREIGVLKALGWKNSRILAMILGESLVLTITSAIIGSLLGIGVAELLNFTNMISPITASITVFPFIQAFTVAIVVGLIGGFYPAWRASRLQPTESLKYE